jgi:hypothetical protein
VTQLPSYGFRVLLAIGERWTDCACTKSRGFEELNVMLSSANCDIQSATFNERGSAEKPEKTESWQMLLPAWPECRWLAQTWAVERREMWRPNLPPAP